MACRAHRKAGGFGREHAEEGQKLPQDAPYCRKMTTFLGFSYLLFLVPATRVVCDQVLRSCVEHMLSTFRHYDMVARYEGEEFSVLLLPNTTLEGAQRALSKVQNRVAKSVRI